MSIRARIRLASLIARVKTGQAGMSPEALAAQVLADRKRASQAEQQIMLQRQAATAKARADAAEAFLAQQAMSAAGGPGAEQMQSLLSQAKQNRDPVSYLGAVSGDPDLQDAAQAASLPALLLADALLGEEVGSNSTRNAIIEALATLQR